MEANQQWDQPFFDLYSTVSAMNPCDTGVIMTSSAGRVSGWCVLLVGVLWFSSFQARVVAQQVELPTRRFLFESDSTQYQDFEERRRRSFMVRDARKNKDTRFSADNVQLDQQTQEMVGLGGVAIDSPGVSARAEKARYNTETSEVRLENNVRFNFTGGTVDSRSATFNLTTEQGAFDAAGLFLEDGQFRILSERIEKTSEFDYEMGLSEFSTCNCKDGSLPWSIVCSGADVEQGGYAHVRNPRLTISGVPVLYSPYLLFPVKSERSSGLLVPRWGYSNRDGALFWQPIYGVIDDSTDFTITPFIEARSRIGSRFDFRKVFSQRSNIDFRVLYSNESRRSDSLRGTRIDDIFDPSVDKNRFGGYYTQRRHTA